MKRALLFAQPYRRSVILFLTLALAELSAAEPLVLKYIFDDLAAHKSSDVLFRGILTFILLSIFREIASAYSNWLTWKTRLGIHYALLENTVERLHRMHLSLYRGTAASRAS